MKFHICLLMLSVLLLSGCAETKLLSHWAKKATWPGQQESKGKYKVGNPYKVGSVWYYPEENFQLVETGIASWYGPGFHADDTANGEVFDQHELTAAHRTLQLPSLARVTNLENGRSVVVRVNDRGPFKHGRIMDVSQRAAELLGFASKGIARVRIEVLEKESRILAAAARRGEDTTRLTSDELHGHAMAAPVIPVVHATPAPVPSSVRLVSLANDNDALPESLRTPTITVEELDAQPGQPADVPPLRVLTAGRINAGRFMPSPVVSMAPVHPTGIFVQAGSFALYENAGKLGKRLERIAPVIIETIPVNGRKLYRVRLGPIASVKAADKILTQVIRAGQGDAKVIKNRT